MASKLSTLISSLIGKTTPVDADKIPILDSENSFNHNWLSFTQLKVYLASLYAPLAKGVTNGDSHDHNGGDGGQISYANLSNLPTLGTAAATASTDYATSAHNHSGVYVELGADAATLTSGTANDGFVLMADGLGGASWEEVVANVRILTQSITVTTAAAVTVDGEGYSLVFPVTVVALPGDGGTLLVEYKVAQAGVWTAWPSGTVSAKTIGILCGPVEALRFTAAVANGIVEVAQ